MIKENLKGSFEKIGANLIINEFDEPIFTIDLRERKGKETYIINFGRKRELVVLQERKDIKHLLLMVKNLDATDLEKTERNHILKYLCGHDERHWFIAAVDNSSKFVDDALDSLKPQIANVSQKYHGVKNKNKHKRHNKGFIRQGEWFFIPFPYFKINENDFMVKIYKNEPISRTGSKPHICQELYREEGKTIYMHYKFAPIGMDERHYLRYIKKHSKRKDSKWTTTTIVRKVFVRGRVRHPDHKTICLNCWHLVSMNKEWEYSSKGNLFYD